MCCFRISSALFEATPTKQDLGIPKGFFSKFPVSTDVNFLWETPLGYYLTCAIMTCKEQNLPSTLAVSVIKCPLLPCKARAKNELNCSGCQIKIL